MTTMTKTTTTTTTTTGYFASRLITLWSMLSYFTSAGRLFMLPLLLFVLISGILLVLTGGLSYVAPFVYAVF